MSIDDKCVWKQSIENKGSSFLNALNGDRRAPGNKCLVCVDYTQEAALRVGKSCYLNPVIEDNHYFLR